MIFLLSVIKIEIKRVLRFLPHIVVGALALCFIIGIISFSASKVLYEKKDKNKVNIAIAMPKDEQSAKILISIIKNMKSIKENCNFIEVDNEGEAYKKIENNEAYGAIIIPTNFVRDILEGTNTPATVMIPNKSSIESMLIKELIDGGTKTLACSQAGIYAIYYEYEQAYHERLTKALQDNINIKYMDHTLQRENYFNHIKISATGELTAIEYYACAGLVLFMLLLGMSFSKYLSPSNKTFYEKLKPYGISEGIIAFARIISVFIVYVIIAFIAFVVYAAICKYSGNDIRTFRLIDYLSLLFVILCVSSFIVCIFTILESQISGTLLLFIISIAMNFISGGFIPTVFLPKSMQTLEPYMFTSVLCKQIGNIFLEQVDVNGFLLALGMLIALYMITAWIVIIKERIIDLHNNKINDFKELVKKKVGK